MHIVLIILVIVIGVLIFYKLPLVAKLVLTIANLIIPDPIPFVDEVIMIAMTASNAVGEIKKRR